MREDAVDVAAFYERPPDPAAAGRRGRRSWSPRPTARACRSCCRGRADRPARRGKGQPENRQREAIVTALYTIAPYPRTPAEVVAALLREAERPAPARPPAPDPQGTARHPRRQGGRRAAAGRSGRSCGKAATSSTGWR